jgi:hypothetical protein
MKFIIRLWEAGDDLRDLAAHQGLAHAHDQPDGSHADLP